jgi:predicted secreted hydrolase
MQNGSVRGWDWMEMQLDDRTDVSLTVERTVNSHSPNARWAMALLPDAKQQYVPVVQLTPLGRWRSPTTGFIYPSGWRVRVPELRLDVTVTPTVRDQEMWDPFAVLGYRSSYWEGSCTIVGTRAGHRVTGRGYTELTGYGSRPPSPQL